MGAGGCRYAIDENREGFVRGINFSKHRRRTRPASRDLSIIANRSGHWPKPSRPTYIQKGYRCIPPKMSLKAPVPHCRPSFWSPLPSCRHQQSCVRSMKGCAPIRCVSPIHNFSSMNGAIQGSQVWNQSSARSMGLHITTCQFRRLAEASHFGHITTLELRIFMH